MVKLNSNKKAKKTLEVEQKLLDQKNMLERKHKGETNKLVLKIGLLKTRAGPNVGEYCGI